MAVYVEVDAVASISWYSSSRACLCELVMKVLCMCMQVNYCSGGHLLVLMLLARVESSMSCKTSTRVAQVTGCLPLPFSHSRRISMLICSASLWYLSAIILTLDPFMSSRRKVPNWTYLVAISTGMLTTLPSVHVNLSSSDRVGLVSGMHVVCEKESRT